MSKIEILEELPKLSAGDRGEILERLWLIEEEEAIRTGPSAEEKALLDRELAEYQKDGDIGSPWSEVEKRLRKRA